MVIERKHKITEILSMLDENYKIVGNIENVYFTSFKSLDNAAEDSLVWVSTERADKQELVENTNAQIILCDKTINYNDKLKSKLKRESRLFIFNF